MLIKVADKSGMWGYGPLWLTFADPKPLKINLDDLDSETRKNVENGIASGVLVEVDKDGNIIKVESKLPKPFKPVQKAVVNEPNNQSRISAMMKQKLTDLLKNGVTTLRREIALIKSRDMLLTMVDIEKANKNRKTVLTIIQNAIKDSQDVLNYDDLIEEEEIETIEIKRENMVVESVNEIKKMNDEQNIKAEVDRL